MKIYLLTCAVIVLPAVFIPIMVYELTTGFCYLVCG